MKGLSFRSVALSLLCLVLASGALAESPTPRVKQVVLLQLLEAGELHPALPKGMVPSFSFLVFSASGELERAFAGDPDEFLKEPLRSGRAKMLVHGALPSIETFVEGLVWPKEVIASDSMNELKRTLLERVTQGMPTVFVIADRALPGLCGFCEQATEAVRESLEQRKESAEIVEIGVQHSAFDRTK